MRYHRFESFKILNYSDKLREIVSGGMPDPVEWVIYPTNKCNLKCAHCIMEEEKLGQQQLSDEVMNKIVNDAMSHNIRTVIFSGGGEPLQHPKTLDVAIQLKCAGIKTGLNTNGLFLPEDIGMIDYLRVSVDAATEQTYKIVKRGGLFKKLEEKLSKLKNINELGLAFLITPDNWQEIYSFCEWAEQFNPDFIHIRPAYLDGTHLRDGDKLRLLMPQILKIKEAIEHDFLNVYFRIDKFDGYWTPKLYDKCRSTPLMAVMAADGRFIVCQDNFRRFGDYNTQSFKEIWYGYEHRNAIEGIDIHNCPRCVEVGYNEIIQNCYMDDNLRLELI